MTLRGIQHRASLSLLLAGSCLLLAACGSTRSGTGVSAAGRQLCRERMAQAEPGTPLEERRGLYRNCLKGIEQERADQTRQLAREAQQRQQQESQASSAEEAQWATPAEQLVHCRTYQQDISNAERQRTLALAPVMRITREHGVTSPQALAATAQYQRSVAELERLIPARLRRGLPLIPDAVGLFLRCDPQELNNR